MGGGVGEKSDNKEQKQTIGCFVVVGFHGVDKEVSEEHVAYSKDQRDQIVEDLHTERDTL